jgi:hypothetical protein
MSTVRFSARSLSASVRLGALSVAAIGSLLMPSGQVVAHAATLHGLFRPAGASFEAAFPVKPKADANTDPLFADFPGAEAAHGYYVTPVARDVLAAPRITAPAPSYIVLTALYESPQQASAAAVLSASADGLHAATIDGSTGYQAVGAVKPTANSTNPASLQVVESVVLLARGQQLFTAFAFTLSARTAEAFTHSIRVLVGAAGASVFSVAPTSTEVASPAQSSTLTDGKRFGGVLVALLVIGVAVWFVQRSRSTRTAASPAAGPAAPAGQSASPQFSWMYDAPPPVPAATETPSDPTGVTPG